ncbi:helix-turn-helix domain-containing protein [Streptomyces chryseus]
MKDGGAEDEERQLIAKRLNYLFEQMHRRGEDPQSNEEVSYHTGVPATEISRLRAGLPLSPMPDPTQLFAQRLQHLFDTRRSNGKLHSKTSVAQACGETRQWVHKLLSGKSKPSLETGTVVGAFFGVEASYFTDDPLRALARHFGIEAGPEFFTAPDDSTVVREGMESIEFAVVLRDEGLKAVLGRIRGARPPSN